MTGSCNKDIIEQPADLSTLSQRYAAYGEGVIAKAAAAKKSFLLYVAFAHMHVPQFCSKGHCGKTGKGHFADALSELDDTIGDIMGSLESHGLRENTLVLVTGNSFDPTPAAPSSERDSTGASSSHLLQPVLRCWQLMAVRCDAMRWVAGDNGPWEVKCTLTGSKGPYLGAWQQENGGGSSAKTTLWEAGHRTVGLASWKGTIAAGQVSPALTSSLDYFPTLAALAGVPIPTDRVYDGIDLTPLLMGKTKTAHTWLFHPNSGASGVNGDDP